MTKGELALCVFVLFFVSVVFGFGRTETYSRFDRNQVCVERTEDHLFGVRIRADEHHCPNSLNSWQIDREVQLREQRLRDLEQLPSATTSTTAPGG